MQVFINISSRSCFYSQELCPSAFTGWLELRWAPFLPCSQLFPGTGSIQILSYTLQRWSLVPIRDQNLVAHPSCMLVHTSCVWGLVDDPSQSLSFFATPHTHPFVIHYTIVDFTWTTMMLEVNFPWTTSSPSQLTFLWTAAGQFLKIHPRHRVPVGRKGSHPLHSPSEWTAYCIYLLNEHHGPVHSLICERKSAQLTSPSHSRSYGWPLFTVLESLATFVINPRWTFQLQWDLHQQHISYHGPTAHHPRAKTIHVETTTSY
jgi:hypothetical protein